MRWTLNVSNDDPIGVRDADTTVYLGTQGVVTIPGSFDPEMLDGESANKFDAVIFNVPREALTRAQLLAIDSVLKGEGSLVDAA